MQEVSDEERRSLVALVTRIMQAVDDERTHLALVADLERRIDDPNISDLIYWPKSRGYERDLTASEVVDAALAYEPFAL